MAIREGAMWESIREALSASRKQPPITVDAELSNGRVVTMYLARAVSLDDPEGAVTIRLSATMVGRIVDVIGPLEYREIWGGR